MFRCGTNPKPKRKSSGWKPRASCIHGNKSFDQTLDLSPQLTSDPRGPSRPQKKLRSMTPGGVPFTRESRATPSAYDVAEDKENTPNQRWLLTQTQSKNNLYLSNTPSPKLRPAADSTKVTRHASADSGIDSMTNGSSQSLPDFSSHDSVVKRNADDKFQKVMDFPKVQLTVTKSSSGFGFTIKGTNPVRVGRVKAGGAADTQGLRNGDFLLSINNRDLTKASVHCVANIIRHSTQTLSLQIARNPHKSSRCTRSPAEGSTAQTNDSRSSNSSESHGIPFEGDVTADQAEKWGTNLTQQATTDIKSKYVWQPELSAIGEEKSGDLASTQGTPASQKWHPDMSHISKHNDTERFVQSRADMTECSDHIYEEIKSVDMAILRSRSLSCYSLTSDSTSSCEPNSMEETSTSQGHSSDMGETTAMTWTTFPDESSMQSGTQHQSSWRSQTEEGSYIFGPPNTENETSLDESKPQPIRAGSSRPTDQSETSRQVATHQLLTSEQDFCRLMKRGIQRFSRPLRHHIMSRAQHRDLFQNIEKLVALSEFHVRSLTEQSFSAEDSYMTNTDTTITDAVGKIYKSKSGIVFDAYKMYCEGLTEALELLEDLSMDRQFNTFLKKLEKLRGFEMSLSEFVQHPMSHFHQLVGNLDRVLVTTPHNHHDYRYIKHVCKGLHRSIDAFEKNRSIRTETSFSSYYTNTTFRTASTDRSTHKPMSRHESYIRNNSTGSSGSNFNSLSSSKLGTTIDVELLELQQKIHFHPNVKPFQLAVPSRHVIYSGELQCKADSSAAPLCAVLCSDLLLLTQKEGKGHLKVIQEPIYLNQILESDFTSKNACEFQILIQRSLSSSVDHQRALSTCGVTEYRFQATNMEQKWAWKTLLEQRIKTCKTYTDSAFCSMEEFL